MKKLNKIMTICMMYFVGVYCLAEQNPVLFNVSQSFDLSQFSPEEKQVLEALDPRDLALLGVKQNYIPQYTARALWNRYTPQQLYCLLNNRCQPKIPTTATIALPKISALYCAPNGEIAVVTQQPAQLLIFKDHRALVVGVPQHRITLEQNLSNVKDIAVLQGSYLLLAQSGVWKLAAETLIQVSPNPEDWWQQQKLNVNKALQARVLDSNNEVWGLYNGVLWHFDADLAAIENISGFKQPTRIATRDQSLYIYDAALKKVLALQLDTLALQNTYPEGDIELSDQISGLAVGQDFIYLSDAGKNSLLALLIKKPAL